MFIDRAGIRPQLLLPTPSGRDQQQHATSFTTLLTKGINHVRALQAEADASVLGLAAGQIDDLHGVMAALERASLALELTIAIRNKLVESYQEIMRLQV